MNEINNIIMVSNERCEIRGKTPVIRETSTGCCLSNSVKSTIIVVTIHTLISLANSHIPLSLSFARVFIHGNLGFPGTARVWCCDVQAKDYRVGFRISFLFGVILHLMLLSPNLSRTLMCP